MLKIKLIFLILIFLSKPAYSKDIKSIKHYLKSHNISNSETKFYIYSRCAGLFFGMQLFFFKRSGNGTKSYKNTSKYLDRMDNLAFDEWFKKNNINKPKYDKNNKLIKKANVEMGELLKKYTAIYVQQKNFTFKNKRYYANGFLLDDIRYCKSIK